MTFYCDTCGKDFQPTVIEEDIAEGGLHMYFACPDCRREYTVTHITKVGIELRKQLRQDPQNEELKALFQKECSR